MSFVRASSHLPAHEIIETCLSFIDVLRHCLRMPSKVPPSATESSSAKDDSGDELDVAEKSGEKTADGGYLIDLVIF